MKKTNFKSRILEIFIYLFLLLILHTTYYMPHIVHASTPAPNAFSQTNTTFGITPSIINITLSPGKKYSYTVSVKNMSQVPIPVSAKIDTFTDEAGKSDYGVNSLSDWLTIYPQDSIISPDKTKKFTLVVNIPKKIPLGGYYASISFTPKYRQISSKTQVQPQIIVPVLANIGAPNASEENGAITNWTMGTFVTKESLKMTEFSVKNLSLYHFSAKPILNLTSVISSKQMIIDQKIVLPGRLRTWNNINQIRDLNIGAYRVQLLVSVGEGITISDEKYVIILPSNSSLLVLLLTLVIVIIISKRKNIHIKKAILIFFEKD